MVYVVLGSRVSGNVTVTRRPAEATRGTLFDGGDTTTFEKASLTLTSSSKSIVMRSVF